MKTEAMTPSLTPQILAMYLGCRMRYASHHEPQDETYELNAANLDEAVQFGDLPILRRLSDMTEEEARYIAWFNIDSEKHLDDDSRVKPNEVDTELIRADGGNMVDGDAALVIEISCRCFNGQLCIRTNGDLEMWDEDVSKQPIERQVENFTWLLSKHFDLFGLIDSGLAIDHKTLEQ